ncbi:phosphomannomutase [Allofrancisella inopinata]|uniref:Phosphomannomutase n=1 Tax=Allofrancisella inopinata TaxID=1085647 RepID=A0AAE6YIH0_9GAMM|nr:phosphomannomutase [Allofrancisella inopinata]QIV96500.1 phosphomannomutase [Allofrancisella inopinata]TDT68506.1 phosphomannomutase [Allofrancisella inopinata]
MKTAKKVIEQSGIKFGTSGARGLVSEFTREVCTAFTFAFLDMLKKTFQFHRVAVAIDNRPSSPDIAAAICGAAKAYGIEVDYYGVLPTPSLALYAMTEQIASIMVTGSHIPFDRNGIKFYRPDGEITKKDEIDILCSEANIEYVESYLPEVRSHAAELYMHRYSTYFGEKALDGLKIGIYEHSSAGRDLYSDLFRSLGGKVVSLERSDEFVPIDTEAVSEADKKRAKVWSDEYGFDIIFSTDGDGDRPLIADEKGDWLRGDMVGLLTANLLGIKALAIPVSCNTAIEESGFLDKVIRTRIGSPYVIEAFNSLKTDCVLFAGFEANGGFLLGSTLSEGAKRLDALPTRDALLPFMVLATCVAKEKMPLSKLVNNLPQRYTSSDRLQDFPKENSLMLMKKGFITPQALLKSFGIDEKVVDINQIDGLRLTLENQVIIHLRPSGNAPELRCYVEAGSQEYADQLVTNILIYIKGQS